MYRLFALLCLLISTVLSGAPPPIDPLVCTLRSDAVAVIAAACSVRVDCHFEWMLPPPGLSLAAWDTLLVIQTQLISPSATTPTSGDARRMFTTPNYVTLPLVAYDNTSLDAVDCAPIAAAPQTLIPPSVFVLIDALGTWQRYVMQENQCPDDNHIGIYSNATGNQTIICVCAPGKLCDVDPTVINSLVSVCGIIAVVIIVVLALYIIICDSLILRALARENKKYHRMKRKQGANRRPDSDVELMDVQTFQDVY